MGQGRLAIGRRIKRLRENKGISRQQVATHLAVDLTAIAAWEAGKYMPREARRIRLASLLDIDAATLFAEEQAPTAASHAVLIDTLSELPGALRELMQNTQKRLRAFRLAAPYSTPIHVQEEFRGLIDRRLSGGSLEVERIEIFYDLSRLREMLSNLLRYEGQPYQVKTICAGVEDIVPAMGGYIFDNDEVVVGAYWTKIPAHNRPALWLRGEPYRTYFSDYWNEIWNRASPLNHKGRVDLDAVKDVALRLGLPSDDWPQFVESAQQFEVGDGQPPLV